MPKTLLLADDSVTIQKVVGITFANEDVELVTVDNGADALARAKDLKPDLIMADVAMPGLGGYELCAAIRRDPELSTTPVLLLTGTFETYDEARAQSAGSSGHIAKPFEAQALINQFYQLVDQGVTQVVDPESVHAEAAAQAQAAPPAAVSEEPIHVEPIQPAATQPVAAQTPQVQPVAAAPATDPGLPDLPNTDFSPPPAQMESPVAPPAEAAAAAPERLVSDPNAVPSMSDLDGDDFSFEDLDFSDSAPSNTNTDTGIFGRDAAFGMSGAGHPSDMGETAFLDPRAAHTPDPLADTIPEDPFADSNDETDEFESPFAEPVVPDPAPTAAAPEPTHEPVQRQAPEPVAPALHAEPLLEVGEPEVSEPEAAEPLEAELLDPEDDLEDATVLSSDAFDAVQGATTLEQPVQEAPAAQFFAPEPEPEGVTAQPLEGGLSDGGSVVLDPADVQNAIEKVAWEAFGTLQDQLQRQVMERVEAAIWEIVPQIAERLVREEVARIRAEADDE